MQPRSQSKKASKSETSTISKEEPTLSAPRSDEAHGTRIETHELVEASEMVYIPTQ